MSTSYAMGLAFGIVTALIIFAVVWKFSKKSMKGTFDERQELVRGRGYKYACFTFLGLLVIDLLIESGDGVYPVEFKKSSTPKKDDVRHFGVLERLNIKIRKGALVCTCPEIEPLPGKDVDCIPASLI